MDHRDRLPENSLAVSRREAIRRVSLMLGGATLVGGSSLLTACERADRPGAGDYDPVGDFGSQDIAFLDEVAETILPETGTPGAKAAAVGPFVALMVTDSYSPEDRAIFRDGMRSLEEASRARTGAGFPDASPEDRRSLLEALDREQLEHQSARSGDQPRHWFRMMKQLTLLGYFTSEIGCTVAQRYVETPGRYEPCVPYTPGETTWADHA